MRIKVWILTEEVNDYYQHGEYFVAVFSNKPSLKELSNSGVPDDRVDHVSSGGGRVGNEDIWFFLRDYNLEWRKQ